VGKLEPGKAPDLLLPILESARVEIPLLVAGSGSLETSLRARGANVGFLGWVEEERLRALMRHAECLLFPSRWQEPLARVLLDGLAVGAAIVAEPTGGTAEIVVDGESGLLARGVEELGRALRRVLGDPDLAHRLREGARLRAQSVFSEDVILPRVESLYRSVAQT
jgi:glycosyltransferase involved in cell wall biosynthesis